MELVPRTKITKAKLGGKSFQYNPNTYSDKTSTTFNEIKTPGISYPILAYGGGNTRNITFEIYLNDKMEKGVTESFIRHIRAYIPVEAKKGYQFKAPKPITFAFGQLVKDCWLVDLEVTPTAFAPNLDRIEATITVTLAIIQ